MLPIEIYDYDYYVNYSNGYQRNTALLILVSLVYPPEDIKPHYNNT
jgi:hypothetical protein